MINIVKNLFSKAVQTGWALILGLLAVKSTLSYILVNSKSHQENLTLVVLWDFGTKAICTYHSTPSIYDQVTRMVVMTENFSIWGYGNHTSIKLEFSSDDVVLPVISSNRVSKVY